MITNWTLNKDETTNFKNKNKKSSSTSRNERAEHIPCAVLPLDNQERSTICVTIFNAPRSNTNMAGSELLKTLLYTINNVLQQEKYRAALAVVKGFRNGAV